MVLVDSSVWIDYFRGAPTAPAERLDRLLGEEPVVVGDLIAIEVLQGFADERGFATAQRLLASLEQVTLGGPEIVQAAAENYRRLRRAGITVRKTVDTVIATRCLVDGYTLLHDDRDFDAFEAHLGLRCMR